MAREVEITFNYENGQEAIIVAKVISAPSPKIYPPVFFFVFDSYNKKSGIVNFGRYTIVSGEFKLLDGTDDEGTSEFDIVKSMVIFEKEEDSNIHRLNIYTQADGTNLPNC